MTVPDTRLDTEASGALIAKPGARPSALPRLARNGAARFGATMLMLLILVAVFAPLLYTIDPLVIDPGAGNLKPWTRAEFTTLAGESFERLFVMGTDSLGRDIWSRVAFGARVSLVVGAAVAAVSLFFGIIFGVVAGYFPRLDGPLMRIMDGMMAIPGILFAILLVAMLSAGLTTVIMAIAIPEVPRVARLVRSVVLTIRQEAYIEAAQALDTPTLKILLRHILPNAIAPLIVQGTYVCATAILVEAILSFLGVGIPAEMPTWGNVMSEGRLQFNQHPHGVLLPGLFVALTVFSVNLLGDALRDTLDPKFNKRAG